MEIYLIIRGFLWLVGLHGFDFYWTVYELQNYFQTPDEWGQLRHANKI